MKQDSASIMFDTSNWSLTLYLICLRNRSKHGFIHMENKHHTIGQTRVVLFQPGGVTKVDWVLLLHAIFAELRGHLVHHQGMFMAKATEDSPFVDILHSVELEASQPGNAKIEWEDRQQTIAIGDLGGD